MLDTNLMTILRRRWPAIAVVALASGIALFAVLQGVPLAPAAGTLPTRLSDQEFWALSNDLSEPNGTFRSENLVSNEHTFQHVVPAIQKQARPDGVYLGVAPDQNFTYILATRPRMAFILDIRRGNLLEHLMYKAIIELSADRAEFVSRLFSKPRPPGLSSATSVAALFAAFDRVPSSEALYRENADAVRHHIVVVHGFQLSDDDVQQLETIEDQFFWAGPGLRYSTSGQPGRRGGGNFPSYEDLMRQTDRDGVPRGYLASEEAFQELKSLEEKNLIVPVVGDFAGPKALRAIGQYIRDHGSIVSAFYVSNVEQYLFQDGVFSDFARSVATLPVDRSSTFIRSVSVRSGYRGRDLGPDGRASALDPIRSFVRDFQAQRVRVYYDVNARSE